MQCLTMFSAWMAAPFFIIGVGISQIQPQGTVILQHSSNFPENLDKLLNIFRRRCLESNLIRYAIIAQAIVRRRGNATLNTPIRKGAKNSECITLNDLIPREGLFFGHLATPSSST